MNLMRSTNGTKNQVRIGAMGRSREKDLRDQKSLCQPVATDSVVMILPEEGWYTPFTALSALMISSEKKSVEDSHV